MCYPFRPALVARGDGPSNPWLARTGLPLYVGEVEAVTLDADGNARSLILNDGIAFAIPADIAEAGWAKLCRGDLICVRHGARWIRDMLAIASVDTLDGQISIVGAELYQR